MNRPTASAAGFTLVEVLIALVVMSIMALMAWQGVDGIVRARDSSQLRLEQTLRLNTVVAQWERDLKSVQETDTKRALTCDGATVRVIRRVPGGVQVVAWAFHPEDGEPAWLRWASPTVTTRDRLDDEWQHSQQLARSAPGQLSALTGVTQPLVYFFYTGSGWSNCQSSQTGMVPAGVRLALGFTPRSGIAGSLVRETQVTP